MRALHQLNPVRAGWLMGCLKPESPFKILDVGCGGGLLAESLARLGHYVTGIDPSPQLIAVAQNHAQTMGLNINYAPILLQQHKAKNYQLITLSEVLEHVDNVPDMLQQAAARLNPQGYLFVSTLNRTPQSWLGAIALAEYVWRLVPRGTHQWQNFIQPAELKHMAQQAGLELVSITGVAYKPWLQTWHLTPHATAINYMMLFRKIGAA